MGPQTHSRGSRTRERHHVLAGQMGKQISHRAHHELQSSRRQDVQRNDLAHHCLGQIGRGGGRLHNHGHAGQDCRRQFFQESPDWKIECVVVDRCPFEGQMHVLRHKGALFGQALDFTVE